MPAEYEFPEEVWDIIKAKHREELQRDKNFWLAIRRQNAGAWKKILRQLEIWTGPVPYATRSKSNLPVFRKSWYVDTNFSDAIGQYGLVPWLHIYSRDLLNASPHTLPGSPPMRTYGNGAQPRSST